MPFVEATHSLFFVQVKVLPGLPATVGGDLSMLFVATVTRTALSLDFSEHSRSLECSLPSDSPGAEELTRYIPEYIPHGEMCFDGVSKLR
ncbi:hypothetical protein SCP_0303980 [Sparassis crispa]|uniref:Uncharacterized protein n=1 Tax=Sparassis crispa TaxID=139825 RepID=A0A401GES8_9APHY|nr:hypothetical protein SCP_0303980 [Sparassis crispa]GBE80679.1 hypothetical protein SCP_0303980 [Sparassis crispa]